MKITEIQSAGFNASVLAGKTIYLTSLGEATAEPYFREVMLGMIQSLVDSGISPEHVLHVKAAPTEFEDAIRYLIQQKIGGLFLCSDLDHDTARTINSHIRRGKLDVISVDTDAPNIERLYCFGSNNSEMGRLLATQFIRDMKSAAAGKHTGFYKILGKMGVVGGMGLIIIGNKLSQVERAQAIYREIRLELPWMDVVTLVETGKGWNIISNIQGGVQKELLDNRYRDLATAVTMATQGKHVYGVFTPRASGTAEIETVIRDLVEREVAPAKQMQRSAAIYGADLTLETASLMDKGRARGTVLQSPGFMGYLAHLTMMHEKRNPGSLVHNSRKSLSRVISLHFTAHPRMENSPIGKQLSAMRAELESETGEDIVPVFYTPVRHVDASQLSTQLYSLLQHTQGAFLEASSHLGAQHAALSTINTELESQKAVLQEQAARLAQYGLVEGLYLYTKNTRGEFTSVSPQTVALLGAKHESEILGKTDADLQLQGAEPRYLPKVQALVAQYEKDERRVLEEGIPVVKVEETLDRISGNVIFLRTMKLPIKDERGIIVGLTGINMDVTQLMQLQNSMLASYEGMPDGVLTSKVQYRKNDSPLAIIETANRSARAQLHIYDEKPRGKTSISLLLPAHVLENERAFLLSGANQIDIPEVFIVGGNRRCYLSSRIVTVTDSEKRPSAFLTYHKDVTALVTSAIAMNEAAHQIASTSDELAVSTEELHRTNVSMETLVHEVSSSAQRTREFLSTLMKDIKFISDSFNLRSQEIKQRIREQARKVSSSIRQQNNATRQIAGFVEVLEEFVDRTGILTLNAAIEAASAGDHGRGFAVIADEIRGLSNRSKSSLKEIQQQMNQITESNDELNTTLESVLHTLQSIITDVFSTLEQNLEKPIVSALTVSDNMNVLANHAEKAAIGIVQIGVSTNELSKTANFLSETADSLLMITVEHLEKFRQLLKEV